MDACYKAKLLFSVAHCHCYDDEIDKYYFVLKNSFHNKFVENGRIKEYYATQTAVAMALYYHAFLPDEIISAERQLLELIARDGYFMKVGVLGARVLFRVLSEFGHSELAFKLITRKEFPSYGYLIEHNATTLWETLDGKQSLNHFFWGDVSAWCYKYIAGIRINPKLSDYNRVEIKPAFIESISECRASRDVYSGVLTVQWRRENGKIDLEVSAPKNIIIVTDYKMKKRSNGITNFYCALINMEK